EPCGVPGRAERDRTPEGELNQRRGGGERQVAAETIERGEDTRGRGRVRVVAIDIAPRGPEGNLEDVLRPRRELPGLSAGPETGGNIENPVAVAAESREELL